MLVIRHRRHNLLGTGQDLRPMTKETMLDHLGQMVRSCVMCTLGRATHADKPSGFNPHVFSAGGISKFMVVGQNPGHNECLVHEPFVGEAGKFFNEQVEANGLSRSDFYITNTVKCYTEKNANPTFEYVSRCEPILRIEIGILRPKLVITLGATAFDVFCPDKKMSGHLGQIVRSEKFEVDIYPIYHPSPRNMAVPERRAKFVEDVRVLCTLIKTLGGQPCNA
jgi:DNA polymerase